LVSIGEGRRALEGQSTNLDRGGDGPYTEPGKYSTAGQTPEGIKGSSPSGSAIT